MKEIELNSQKSQAKGSSEIAP